MNKVVDKILWKIKHLSSRILVGIMIYYAYTKIKKKKKINGQNEYKEEV